MTANSSKSHYENYRHVAYDLGIKLEITEETAIRHALANIPESWRFLDDQLPPEPHKKRMTFYVDEAVLKFFQSQGTNWQARMRLVLRSFVSLRTQRYLTKQMPSVNELVALWFNRSEQNTVLELVESSSQHVIDEGFDLLKVMALKRIAHALFEYQQIINMNGELPSDGDEFDFDVAEARAQDGEAHQGIKDELIKRILREKDRS